MYMRTYVGIPMDAQRGCQIPWNWSCRRLWATQKIWVLGTELRSCARTVKALNYRAIFSGPCNSLSYNSNLRKFTFFSYSNDVSCIFKLCNCCGLKINRIIHFSSLQYFLIYQRDTIQQRKRNSGIILGNTGLESLHKISHLVYTIVLKI